MDRDRLAERIGFLAEVDELLCTDDRIRYWDHKVVRSREERV